MRWKTLLGCVIGAAAMCSAAVAQLNICVEPWDNGGYDEQGAQQSQVGYGEDWRRFGHITFDDFWLCEGNEYRIHTVRGILCTNAAIPKAHVVITADCDGTPSYEIAAADSVPRDTTGDPLGTDCLLGSVELRETGSTNADGLRIIEVIATFPKLWLRGGYYWVSIYGYSGNANPLDEFYWGFAGHGIVKGRPGKFYNSDDGTYTDADGLCCGCTDFAFSVEADKCKILLDNGVPDYLYHGSPNVPHGGNTAIPGFPSLQNGTRTSDKSRAADQFVVPPCTDYRLCYIQGWLLSNCTRARLDIYEGGCHCPTEAAPLLSKDSSCMTLIGPFNDSGLNLYKVEFYDWVEPFNLEAGKNYWLSVYGLGDNRQNARSYFSWNYYCGDRCSYYFDPACTKGAPYDTSHWVKSSPAHDLAFLVGVEPNSVETTVGSSCPGDFNHVDGVTVQDLFDFLAAWFTGCP